MGSFHQRDSLLGQGTQGLHCGLFGESFWNWMVQTEIAMVEPGLCHRGQEKTQLGIKSESEWWGHDQELESEDS